MKRNNLFRPGLTGLVASAALILAFCVSAQPAGATGDAKKPIIVFILADNLGYGEIGGYGRGVTRGAPTPRTDRLAQSGLPLERALELMRRDTTTGGDKTLDMEMASES